MPPMIGDIVFLDDDVLRDAVDEAGDYTVDAIERDAA